MKIHVINKFSVILICILLLITFSITNAQSVVPIECGAIVEAETTPNHALHDYRLEVNAGTTLDIILEPIGNTFNIAAFLMDSGGSLFAEVNKGIAGASEEFSDLVVSSSNAVLRVIGVPPEVNYQVNRNISQNYGAYRILLGCTLRDGTVIEPGATPSNNSVPVPQPTASFSGAGFPGLAPVDFTNAFKLPLSLGVPMPGQIPPSGDAVLGLTFDASVGDTFALDFARTSGNLNLGIVVLSANNEVVFQASLVTSQSLSTRLTLPSAGQYTIGVFRIDLLPPAAPEATQFQITGTLNP